MRALDAATSSPARTAAFAVIRDLKPREKPLRAAFWRQVATG